MVISSATIKRFITHKQLPLNVRKIDVVEQEHIGFGLMEPIVQALIMTKIPKSERREVIQYVIGNIYTMSFGSKLEYKWQLMNKISPHEIETYMEIKKNESDENSQQYHYLYQINKNENNYVNVINTFLLQKYQNTMKLNPDAEMQIIPIYGIYGFDNDINNLRTHMLAAVQNGDYEMVRLFCLKMTRMYDFDQWIALAFEKSFYTNNLKLIRWLNDVNMGKLNINFVKKYVHDCVKQWQQLELEQNENSHISNVFKKRHTDIITKFELLTEFANAIQNDEVKQTIKKGYSKLNKMNSFLNLTNIENGTNMSQ